MGDDEDDLETPSLRDHSTMSVTSEGTVTNNWSSSTKGHAPMPQQRKQKKHSQISAYSIQYRGENIYRAAQDGNLPLCVMLWGMASAKRVNLFAPDAQGNTVMHAAALSNNPEIITFLLLQASKFEEVPLLHCRNQLGETPLLTSCSRGDTSVVRALINAGSNIFWVDNQGDNIVTKLSKAGHLWCLNYVIHEIMRLHGEEIAQLSLNHRDHEQHSALDWAADIGHVNMMEYLIRKGLNPLVQDKLGRDSLWWAVKSQHVDAAKYLLQFGCQAHQQDSSGKSLLSLATTSGSKELLNILRGSDRCCTFGGPKSFGIADGKFPEVIYNHNRSSLWMTSCFCAFFLMLWLCTTLVPFYIWTLAVFGSWFGYRELQKMRRNGRSFNCCSFEDGPLANSALVQKIVKSHEKGLGLWMATIILYAIYLMSSFYYLANVRDSSPDYTILSHVSHKNLFHVGGVSGGVDNEWLLWLTTAALCSSTFLWIKVVWLDRDPGIIHSRATDFDDALQSSLLAGGPPLADFCSSTLVRKPLRSKYCVKTGAVVARMDHYCVWLNITVGFRNHRWFLLLLFSHLVTAATGTVLTIRGLSRDINSEPVCSRLSELLSREYFFIVVFCGVLIFALIGLGALFCDQCYNIAKNLTTNERINGQRYDWILEHDGVISSSFDHGMIANVLEFLGVPGYSVNYMTSFRVNCELTQDNVRANSGRHKDRIAQDPKWSFCMICERGRPKPMMELSAIRQSEEV